MTATDLLRLWIDEYGDDRAPDLDRQIAEMQAARLAIIPSAWTPDFPADADGKPQ